MFSEVDHRGSDMEEGAQLAGGVVEEVNADHMPQGY